MATMQTGPKAARPEWSEVMSAAREGVFGSYIDLRHAAAQGVAESIPAGDGISSSDVNHQIYQTISFHVAWTGEWPTPEQAIELVSAG
jgi:hypothetical protein